MRKIVLLAAVAAFSFLSVGAASAHVTVNPSSAPKGGFAKLTFRVPNERDDASTTKLEVAFPAGADIEFVSVKPVPGWTFTVAKEPTTTIVWSGGKIGPGEFQEFDVSVGPLPDKKDSLTFKALQTYDSGEVVRWIDIQKGEEEPEHPAPVLTLTAATSDHHAASSDEETEHDETSSSSDGLARALGGLGLLAGLGGLGLAASKRGRAS